MIGGTVKKEEVSRITYLVTAWHYSNHYVATEHLPILTQSFPGLQFGLEH